MLYPLSYGSGDRAKRWAKSRSRVSVLVAASWSCAIRSWWPLAGEQVAAGSCVSEPNRWHG